MRDSWISKIIFTFLRLVALVAVIFVALHFRGIRVGYISEQLSQIAPAELGKQIAEFKESLADNFPEARGEQQKTYQWQYKDKKYSISQTLYTSIYEFYKAQPKTYVYFDTLSENWEEEYYGMFIVENEKDVANSELLQSIVVSGRKNGLSDDQLPELVLSFAQSIPYDSKKAANILAHNGSETISYPYETLFENKGVCSDKSFLATVLLRKLGYGTAIFVFEKENHMAVGIQCPQEYSNYGSGYCFAETTSIGNKIGIIPELKADVGSAVGGEQIAFFDQENAQIGPTTKLTDVKIFQKTQGKEYAGIVQTVNINNEITVLKKEISSLNSELKIFKAQINADEKSLTDKKKALEKYLKNNDIEKYNEQAKKYNDLLKEYENEIKLYNKKINTFNAKVVRYNYLIKL